MYIVETRHTGSRDPALQFVGSQDEIVAFNKRIIPTALGALAGQHITYRDVDHVMEDIGRFGTLDSIPNKWKGAGIIMLGVRDLWLDNLVERRQSVVRGAAEGSLTSAQVDEEIALIGQLRKQPEATWLTPDGFEAIRRGRELAVATMARDEGASPWDEFTPTQLELADRFGATHMAWHYELTFAPAEPFAIPVVGPMHYQLGTEDEAGFHPLVT